ncbi:MAG: class I SAM-dependent methyltransferase [Pseudomonadota bacterium]
MDKSTHFGFKDVAASEKAGLVRGVFDSVADNYDIMNDLMSAGLHRLWKRATIGEAGVRPGHRVLDLAGGTGDLAIEFARKVGESGRGGRADIKAAKRAQGRPRGVDEGVVGQVDIAQVDAENLPFDDNHFDRITIAFGLRNVTDKNAALRSMYRVLKPGGKCLVLEFSQPADAIQPAYDLYSFRVLPMLGKLVAGDADSYQYLAESIRKHPDQETLKSMMQDAGFERCRYRNFSAGIVALHMGYKV